MDSHPAWTSVPTVCGLGKPFTFKANDLCTVDAKLCLSAQKEAGRTFLPLSLSGHFLSDIAANPLLDMCFSRRFPVLAFIINCIAGHIRTCGQRVTVIPGLGLLGSFCRFATDAESCLCSDGHPTHCLKHFPAVSLPRYSNPRTSARGVKTPL